MNGSNRISSNINGSNKISSNRISSNRISSNINGSNRISSNINGSNKISSNRISSNRISSNTVVWGNDPVVSTAVGEFIECAFDWTGSTLLRTTSTGQAVENVEVGKTLMKRYNFTEDGY
ncbi:hypothetical protein PoB_000129000 [Plakobranchus ocellatus]|uniref:Uncharacterized protein n=1 Tax=Plakobranchus ocellatus TaxID=259542 RepID=A0AAV3XWJ1_9GAST|nr:hypothetical protein PoB_000129000 [Plakobranchus ocellatus]